ncbi:hypothetical protein GCM10027589_58270 [Actinocorallia lasiicapitis]
MNDLAAKIESSGGQVVAHLVQRRGVSAGKPGRPLRGGRSTMHLPYSRHTLLTTGKAQELATLAHLHHPDLIVFHNPLTPHQRKVLTHLTTHPVTDHHTLP